MRIIINASTPSKKNSRINTRSGRSFPSSKYTAWHKIASSQLLGASPFRTNLLTLTFVSGDNRKFDLTNKAESIMDLLVDCGLIDDDNYSIIPELHLRYGGMERNNPHCIIEY